MSTRPINLMRTPAQPPEPLPAMDKTAAQPGFADHLKASIMTANALQHKSSTAQVELATGRNGNIHETLIAMNKSSVSFHMIQQVRNKVVSAYQEILRMQV